jgi:hypothetical protein
MTEPDDYTVRCRRCGRVIPGDELDRILWCEDCVTAEGRLAARRGRVVALLGAGLLAVWIAISIRPGDQFLALWAIVILVAYALGARLARELIYGIARMRNRPGARAIGVTGNGQ